MTTTTTRRAGASRRSARAAAEPERRRQPKASARWRRCCWRRTATRSPPRLPAHASAASLSDIRYFTQRGIFSGRILDQMGIQRLRDDLDALTATDPALAERLAAAPGSAARYRARHRLAGAAAVRPRGNAKTCATRSCATRRCRGSSRGRSSRCAALIRQIARRLRERYSKPRKRQRRGHLDVRRTIRRNAAWGGVPFLTAWKRKTPRQAEDRGALRRLGLGGAGLRFLPAADPQPARGGVRRALVRLLRAPDRGQRHPRRQSRRKRRCRRSCPRSASARPTTAARSPISRSSG